jgi:hydrogenase maturation protease
VSNAGGLAVGLGNRLCGDDGAGLEVVRLVRQRAPRLRVIEHEREPSALIDLWHAARLAIVVDALEGAHPGRVHRLEPPTDEIGDRRSPTASTHALGLGDIVELARALNRLPERLVVYGIEGFRFETGAEMSAPVRRAVGEVADLVIAELGAHSSGGT